MSEHKLRPKLVRLKGRRKFYIQWIDINRQPIRKSTGTEDSGEAQIILSQFIAELNAPGDDPIISILLDKRIDDLISRNRRSIKNAQDFHNQLKKHFGDFQVKDIKRLDLLTTYRTKRQDTQAALIRELEELRAAISLAHDNGWITCDVPKIKLPARLPPRELYMTKAQAKMMLSLDMPHHLRLFLMIALTTGRRTGAILDLTWDRVDLQRKRLNFINPDIVMTKKKRGVSPVANVIIPILKEAQIIAKSDYVVEWNNNQVGSIKRAFNRLSDDAKLSWVTPHILKHSVISWLAEDGYSIQRISEMTDTDPKTVDRVYKKFSPDYLEDVAETLSNNLFAVTPCKQTQKGV